MTEENNIITSVKSFLEKINNPTNPRGEYIYRGQADEEWLLRSGAARRLFGSEKTDRITDPYLIMPYICDLIKNSKNRRYHRRKETELSDLELLAELQHYGAATFLLDFTRNPLAALWVACSSFNKISCLFEKKDDKVIPILQNKAKDGKIFIIDINNNNFHRLSHQEVENFSVDKIETLLQLFVNDVTSIWDPAHLNERIPVQSSVFLFGKEPLQIKIQEFTILANCKIEILEELETRYGINETYFYPDFYGFANANSSNRPNSWKREFLKIFTDTDIDADRQINSYSQLLKENPFFYPAYHNRGWAYIQKEEYDKAIDDYNQLIKLVHNNAGAYLNRGWAYHKQKKYEEAIKDYITALKYEPRSERSYNNRENAYKEMGKENVKTLLLDLKEWSIKENMPSDWIEAKLKALDKLEAGGKKSSEQ